MIQRRSRGIQNKSSTHDAETTPETQHFDSSQDDDVDMPHVEDRSARRDEIEYEALQRKHEETQMVEQRQQRLLEEQSNHLKSLARDQELKDYELAEMLKQAQHQELQHAARLASTETQAEALIRNKRKNMLKNYERKGSEHHHQRHAKHC